MLVGICDFPSRYTFPPKGYGGIERWLWATAVGARQAGADVHLLGPQWRPELADSWAIHPIRLEDLDPASCEVQSLRDANYDLFIVGHEYPSLAAWRATRDAIGGEVATFQHWPYFRHQADVFDGVEVRLYCYSDEMCQRYADHKPSRLLAVHLGWREVEQPVRDDGDLLWLGRIDRQKAPHLAIKAAQVLDRRITIAGPVFDEEYVRSHGRDFASEHVVLAGEVAGEAKMTLLAQARAVVYTCAAEYIEAGAATFGESLRAGTPVAALAWRPGSCGHAALCPETGALAVADPHAGEETAVARLAEAIEAACRLKAADVQEVGRGRFNPTRHFEALAASS